MASSRFYYQGGQSCLVFDAGGKDPAKRYRLKATGGVRRAFDTATKGYTWVIEGGAGTRLSLGESTHARTGALGLVHKWIVFQLFLPGGGHCAFSVELLVSDASGNRRRMLLSTAFASMTSTPLHAQVPLAGVFDDVRGGWLSWRVDLPSMVKRSFGGSIDFHALDGISIGPSCKLRAVFSTRDAVSPAPPTHDFPAAIDTRDAAFPTVHDVPDGPLQVIGRPAARNSQVARREAKVHIAFGSRSVKSELPKSTPPSARCSVRDGSSTSDAPSESESSESPRVDSNTPTYATTATAAAGVSLDFQSHCQEIMAADTALSSGTAASESLDFQRWCQEIVPAEETKSLAMAAVARASLDFQRHHQELVSAELALYPPTPTFGAPSDSQGHCQEVVPAETAPSFDAAEARTSLAYQRRSQELVSVETSSSSLELAQTTANDSPPQRQVDVQEEHVGSTRVFPQTGETNEITPSSFQFEGLPPTQSLLLRVARLGTNEYEDDMLSPVLEEPETDKSSQYGSSTGVLIQSATAQHPTNALLSRSAAATNAEHLSTLISTEDEVSPCASFFDEGVSPNADSTSNSGVRDSPTLMVDPSQTTSSEKFGTLNCSPEIMEIEDNQSLDQPATPDSYLREAPKRMSLARSWTAIPSTTAVETTTKRPATMESRALPSSHEESCQSANTQERSIELGSDSDSTSKTVNGSQSGENDVQNLNRLMVLNTRYGPPSTIDSTEGNQDGPSLCAAFASASGHRDDTVLTHSTGRSCSQLTPAQASIVEDATNDKRQEFPGSSRALWIAHSLESLPAALESPSGIPLKHGDGIFTNSRLAEDTTAAEDAPRGSPAPWIAKSLASLPAALESSYGGTRSKDEHAFKNSGASATGDHQGPPIMSWIEQSFVSLPAALESQCSQIKHKCEKASPASQRSATNYQTVRSCSLELDESYDDVRPVEPEQAHSPVLSLAASAVSNIERSIVWGRNDTGDGRNQGSRQSSGTNERSMLTMSSSIQSNIGHLSSASVKSCDPTLIARQKKSRGRQLRLSNKSAPATTSKRQERARWSKEALSYDLVTATTPPTDSSVADSQTTVNQQDDHASVRSSRMSQKAQIGALLELPSPPRAAVDPIVPPAHPEVERARNSPMTQTQQSREEQTMLQRKLEELAAMEDSFRGEFGSLSLRSPSKCF